MLMLRLFLTLVVVLLLQVVISYEFNEFADTVDGVLDELDDLMLADVPEERMLGRGGRGGSRGGGGGSIGRGVTTMGSVGAG